MNHGSSGSTASLAEKPGNQSASGFSSFHLSSCFWIFSCSFFALFFDSRSVAPSFPIGRGVEEEREEREESSASQSIDEELEGSLFAASSEERCSAFKSMIDSMTLPSHSERARTASGGEQRVFLTMRSISLCW